MKSACLLLACLAATPAIAQQNPAPYPVEPGQRVRVFPERSEPMVGTSIVGVVHSADADSLTLRTHDTTGAIAWGDVARMDRSVQNRTGEAIGLVAGGVIGGLLGYVGGDALLDNQLGGAAFVPGGLVGMFVGGILGARISPGWEPLSSTVSLRATLPLK